MSRRSAPRRGEIPRALRPAREPPVRGLAPQRSAGDLVQGPLHGGAEDSRPVPGRRGQVPHSPQVPPAQDDLGRRGDRLLLQGEEPPGAQGLLPTESVPDA